MIPHKPRVHRDGNLFPHHLLEVDLGLAVRVWRVVEEPSADLHEGAGHVDVVVREVEEQLLEAEEALGLGEHVELDQLADEAADLQL